MVVQNIHAELISGSIDDVLQITEAIAADDIESLMQAKQKYISRLDGFVSKDQEEKLDELTIRVTDKIKEAVQKKDVYDDLYAAVSDGFKVYAGELMKYPKLFNTLVSAEYLYKQYVDEQDPNDQFDYSCISIMYYMALEDFANKLVYIPYANDVLTKIPKKTVRDKTWKDTEGLKYVSAVGSFWDKYQRVKKSCEIGVLGYLFEGVEDEEYFKNYVLKCYPKADMRTM